MAGHQSYSRDPCEYAPSIDFAVVGDSIRVGRNQAPFHPTPKGQHAIYMAVKAALK